MHQLLCQSVWLHAAAVHPVPCGFCPLQDPASPRQDKVFQVHIVIIIWLWTCNWTTWGQGRRSLCKGQRGRNLPITLGLKPLLVLTLEHTTMDSTYVQAPEELYDLGPHSKIAWSLLLRKKKVTETWLVPQLEWISQGQNGVF